MYASEETDAEAEAEPVLVPKGIEVVAPVEPPTVEPPTVEDPTLVEEPGTVKREEVELNPAVEDSAAPGRPVAETVAVGVALVSVGVELEKLVSVVLTLGVVVTTGGTEMGWPADEHCATTTLETADWD